MDMIQLNERLNRYVGRGLMLGVSADGRRAGLVYFIMGRSDNSRNRVFRERADGSLFTEPHDPARTEDPSLIIYRAACPCGNGWIVSNGDQTDTIAAGLADGRSFFEALETREFEPDAPHYTPRISGLLTWGDGGCSYRLSLLKSVDGRGGGCLRAGWVYPGTPGLGHFLHTYEGDGQPLPSFEGEPERVAFPDDFGAFAREIWAALHPEHKISLYVRETNLQTHAGRSWLFNRREGD